MSTTLDTDSEVTIQVLTARLAFTAQEFADLIGIPHRTVLELIEAGEIAYVPAGRHKLIPAWAVRRWLQIPEPRQAPG